MKSSGIAVSIIFVFMGLVFLLFGIGFSQMEPNVLPESRIYTNATITKIESRHHPNDNTTDYDVFVEYEIDDTTYNEELNTYTSDYYEGKTIPIYYDKDNYHNIGTDDSDTIMKVISTGIIIFAIIFMGVGILIAVLTIFIAGKVQNDPNSVVIIGGDNTKLKQTGKLIHATISTVLVDSEDVFGPTYKVICTWTNPDTGYEQKFESQVTDKDPRPYIEENNILTVPVYVHSKVPARYYVDITDFIS